jgi:hypothetical protein
MNQAKSNGNGVESSAQFMPMDSSFIPSDSAPNLSTEPLSQADRDLVLRMIADIRSVLPFLQNINADDRKSRSGMGDQNRIFAGKVLEVIQQNADFLPRSFDIDKLKQNLETFDRLSTILMALDQLRNLVNATAISVGSEAYDDSLTAYRHGQANGLGASTEAMFADLQQRFFRKTKKKDGEEQPAAE